ncbi:MAG TPA: hypothetical protein VGI45_30250 [Terracidiphilus sp.]|jgi:hypothetical protein
MRSVCAVAGAALLACNTAGFAESKVPCSQTADFPLQSRTLLIIESKPAGLHIVGTDQKTIHISCTAGSEESAEGVAFHFSPNSDGGKLSIEGIHMRHGNNSLDVKIEVPRRTDLRVRMFAGEVKVEEVKGDKDIDLGAGQITISSIHDGDYRSVDASVGVGEVQAGAFGSDKGGFFRTFTRKTTSGDYRLHAHVTTGEIDLRGNASHGKGTEAKPD